MIVTHNVSFMLLLDLCTLRYVDLMWSIFVAHTTHAVTRNLMQGKIVVR